MECPICQENYHEDTNIHKYPVLIGPCSHNICKTCFDGHIDNDDKCPICRHEDLYETPVKNIDLLKAIQLISFNNELSSIDLDPTKQKINFNGKVQLYYNLYNRGKIKLNDKDLNGNTLLLASCYDNKIVIINELLEHPDTLLDIVNNSGNTILTYLCQNELLDQAEKFIHFVETRNIKFDS